MIIVWAGWGIIVPAILFVAAMGAGVLEKLLVQQGVPVPGLGYTIMGVAAGVAIWLINRALESRPGRVLIDKATGREFKVGASSGSFFFIPTRYWSYIAVALGLLAGLSVVNHWKL